MYRTHIAKGLILIVALLLVAPACSQKGGGSGIGAQEVGGVLGGVAGGILGSQFGSGSGKTAATIAGVLVGAAAGSYVGSRMDAADRAEMNKALEYNRTGQTTAWRNPDDDTRYAVTPTNTYKPEPNKYCREYTQKVWIDGRQETAYGTACRQPDGRWKIVNHDG